MFMYVCVRGGVCARVQAYVHLYVCAYLGFCASLRELGPELMRGAGGNGKLISQVEAEKREINLGVIF